MSVQTIALHEAGHAVIGRVLTLLCGKATIEPNYALEEAGYALCEEPFTCESAWEKRGKVRGECAVWHARIIMMMAGREAVEEIVGFDQSDGDREDRYQINLMLEDMPRSPVTQRDFESKEKRLRGMTRMLVRRHRLLIERVAEALLVRTTRDAIEIDQLADRSIEDVKVNAPLLLAMHSQRSTFRTSSHQR